MKLLIGILVALFAAVGIGQLLREDPGYVLLTVGDWTIETSVAALIVIALVGFFVLYKAIRWLTRLYRMPRTLKQTSQRRRARKAQKLLDQGMRALAEGRWATAETALTRGAALAEAPALYWAGAARAAQRQAAAERRDKYLAAAAELPRDSVALVGITRAELLLEDDEAAKARDELHRVERLVPKHPRVLELQLEAASRLGDWSQALALLPELRKRKALDESGFRDSQLSVHRERLAALARSGTLAQLQEAWAGVPKALRADETLLIDYVGHLREHSAADQAEKLLREAIGSRWSHALVVAFGQLGRGDPLAQLRTAEGWLSAHADDPYLLLTLGRLAVRAHQPAKAREHLERSLRQQPLPDAYQELGELLEQLNDPASAAVCYRAGLRLLTGKEEVKEGETLPALRDTPQPQAAHA